MSRPSLMRRLLLYPSGGAVAYHDASSLALPAGATITRAGSALRLWHSSAWASAVYEAVSADTARFERTPEGDVGLLIEGARTNSQIRSRDLTNASWNKYFVTASTGAGLGLDGGDCSVITDDNTTNTHSWNLNFASAAAATNYCAWALVKRHSSGTRNARLSLGGTAGITGGMYVDPDDGSIVSGPTGTYSAVIARPSGWYQMAVGGASDVDGGNILATWWLTNGTNATYAGDSTSNMLWDFFTIENGLFPSSPTATTTAAATRNADVYAQTATAPAGGGFAVELIARTAPGKAGDQVLWMLAVDANNWCAIERNSSGAIVAEMRSGGTTVSVTGATVADSTKCRIAASFAANSLGLAVNGTAATRNTSCAYPVGSLTVQTVGHDRANANHWFGHAIRWPKGADWLGPKTDSELQALTA